MRRRTCLVMATVEVEVGDRIMLAKEEKMGRLASMALGPMLAMVALGVHLISLPYQSRPLTKGFQIYSFLNLDFYTSELDVVVLPAVNMAEVVAVL